MLRSGIVFKMYGILKLIIIGNRKFEIYSIENICDRWNIFEKVVTLDSFQNNLENAYNIKLNYFRKFKN